MEECYKLLTDQVDWTNPEGNQVRINVNRPLPLGGTPDRLTIQTQFFFNKYLEYLRYGNKGSCPALSISKIKAARYPDFGLELLVPEQMWIEDVCSYDISAKYEVRSTMRILSVIRIKAYPRYGYDYLSEIVLRRADYQEHTIAEKDFKNLDKYGMQMIMCFNEIYKFSDGTLQQIDEALDYRVKEFRVNKVNLGLNTSEVAGVEEQLCRSVLILNSTEHRLGGEGWGGWNGRGVEVNVGASRDEGRAEGRAGGRVRGLHKDGDAYTSF
ncbi:hypothetical protein Tco_0765423 [Tanacetum coccineum]